MKDYGENGVWWKKKSTAQGLQRDYQANKELLNEERDINKWLVIS